MSTIKDVLKQHPYYDDYDSSKKYTHLLAVPGRVEQAREFTQLQSSIFGYMKKVSDVLMKEGNIVSGMSYHFEGNNLVISDGSVYMQGLIHEFSEQSIELTRLGKETVGVKLDVQIITEGEDTSLKDPAIQSVNYANAGCHRLKAEPVLVVNDDTCPPLYTFVDGILQSDPIKPQMDTITDILARRTYDESGNYRVNGLHIWVEPEESDQDNLTLVVESGKAYVMGYEVIKPHAVRVQLPKAKERRTVYSEPKTYTTNIKKYPLNNHPLAVVKRLMVMIAETKQMTRGATPNGMDYLPNSPVVRIVNIPGYTQGIDYQLTQDAVDWSLGGTEPAVGSSYSVEYNYNKILSLGDGFTTSIEQTTSSVVISNGVNIVNNSQMYIDYDFYLSRKDLISVDKVGNIVITKGQSDVIRQVTTPINNDPQILHLGTALISANSTTVVVNPYSITRLDMEQLGNMLRRIEDIEYNQALTSLDREALDNEQATDLKGILSEGFNNLSKADLQHPLFSGAFSLESGEMQLRSTDTLINKLSVDFSTSRVAEWERLVTAPFTEEVVLSQLFASNTMLVNPYSSFNNLCSMTLSPASDNWVDTENIVVEQNKTATYTIGRWWWHGGTPYTDTEKYLYNNLILDKGQSWGGWDDKSGTIITSSSKTLLDEAITYMRQIEITLTCSNLSPSADNLELLFDNKKVDVTPVSGYQSGSTSGTLRANASGNAKGKFLIPGGVRTGTREVVLKNANNIAATTFTANGRRRVVETTVINTRVTVLTVDPLAQTFQFDTDRMLTSVGLYFNATDRTKNVIVQIRNTVNGYPGNVVYAEKVVPASSVKGSNDSSVETKVKFGDPIMCTAGVQYCVVIETDSPTYSMFIAELGGKDYLNKAAITKQPFADGVLFSSSNALTWTAHQSSDLKFKVYCAKFETSGVINFSPLSSLDIDSMVVMSDFLTFQGSTFKLEAKLDNGLYEPIGNYEERNLSNIVKDIAIRASYTTNGILSPLFVKDSALLTGFKTALSSSYISRNVSMPEPGFKTVKQTVECFLPDGCDVAPKFSFDGETWLSGTLGTTTGVDGKFVRREYSYTVPNNESRFSYRARLDLISNSRTSKPIARKFINIMK